MSDEPTTEIRKSTAPPATAAGAGASRSGARPGAGEPEFAIVLRGYERGAVDAYVARMTQLVAELQATRSPQSAVKSALDRVGEETASILQRAHETAEQVSARSRAHAEERLQLAETEAEGIRAGAEARVRKLDADTDVIWQERRRLIEDVRKVADALLAVTDDALERFPPEEAAPAPGAPATPAKSAPLATPATPSESAAPVASREASTSVDASPRPDLDAPTEAHETIPADELEPEEHSPEDDEAPDPGRPGRD